MNIAKPFSWMGGLDRTNSSLYSNLSGFYNLLNFRQSAVARGDIEQTPYWSNTASTQGTYWTLAGASATEPSSSSIRGNINSLKLQQSILFSDYVIRGGLSTGISGTQIKIYEQSVVPAVDGLTKGCFIDILDDTAMGLNLGSTLDIVIDGAATFKWRINGGAYTVGVACSTTGTTLSSGAVRVYFLTNTGFTINDTWSWLRTDRLFEAANPWLVRQIEYEEFGPLTYFMNYNGRLMFLKASSSTVFAITSGYRPIYGNHFKVYEGHMFVFGGATTAYTNQSLKTSATNSTIINSDNIDPQCFFSTDTNEADSYTLPVTTWILGATVLNSLLFVFTEGLVYYTNYSGLPIPFSFKEFTNFAASRLLTAANGTLSSGIYSNYNTILIPGVSMVYVLTQNGLWTFDGSNFRRISDPIDFLIIRVGASVTGLIGCLGFYDKIRREFCFYGTGPIEAICCYQEDYGTFYFRGSSFLTRTGSGFSVTCLAETSSSFLLGTMFLGAPNLTCFHDETGIYHQPVKDASQGTAYTEPTITTHCIAVKLTEVKEITSSFVTARVLTTSSTFYSTGSNLLLKLYWYTSDSGDLTTTPATNAAATWNNGLTSGQISLPRVPFRSIAFELRATTITASKPPAYVTVCGFEPSLPETIAER